VPTWKRYKGKKVLRGDPNYGRGTWIAEGKVEGQYYKIPLPKETFKTADDAQRRDEDIRKGIRDGDYSFLLDKTKFLDFVDSEYLPHAKQKNDSYQTKVFETNPLKEFFKDKLLKSFTPLSCEQYKNWRRVQFKRCQKCAHQKEHDCTRELISFSTVNRETTTLSAILKHACFLGKLKQNPMMFVDRLNEPESRERFLTVDEKARLLQETASHKLLHLAVLLGIMTGWRSGQILSQKKSDLDEPTKTTVLIKSKQQRPRRVPLSDEAWMILMFLAGETPGDYLFYNPKTGTRYLSFKRKWNECLERAGIKDFHFHDLRRTFATDMLEARASDLVIQNALGHSKIDTTFIYAKTDRELLRQSLNAVSSTLNLDMNAILTPSGKNERIEVISDAAN
jgi:integrase